MVMVNEDLKETSTSEAKVLVEMDGKTTQEVKFSNRFSPGEIELICSPTFRELNSVLKVGYNNVYEISVKNLTDKEQKNVEITLNKNNSLEINTLSWNIDENNFGDLDKNSTTFTLPSVPANGTVTIVVDAMPIDAGNDYVELSANANVSNTQYRSNKVIEKIEGATIQSEYSSEVNGKDNTSGFVNIGDKITYTLKLKNTGKVDIDQLEIKNYFSDYLKLSKVTINGKECEYEEEVLTEEDLEYNILAINSSIKIGAEAVVKIEGIVRDNILEKENIKISNKFSVYNNSIQLLETKEIINEVLLENNSTDDPNNAKDNPSNNSGNNSGNNQGSDINNNGNNTNNTFIIKGTVWEDSNNNGARDQDEKVLEGIKVYAIDVETNKIATNNNEEITATTGNDGIYTLSNLAKGKYIVAFEYDTDKYMVTTYQAKGVNTSVNSDAVKASRMVNGQEKLAAYTDSINLENSIANIDLGLAEAKEFSLKLEKTISKMIVTNKNGSKTYNFEDTDMAKVEIAAKELSGSNVVIEYKFKVTNVGEVAGYAKTIVDYLPSSLTFNSGLNSDWYQKGENIYTSSLANTKIEPGETKEVKLVLTKKMTESNTGLTNNKAEIINSYNTLGVTNASENASKQNNNKESKAKGSADTIIGVKTGAAVSYVALTLTVVIVIAAAVYLVNKKLLIEKIEI